MKKLLSFLAFCAMALMVELCSILPAYAAFDLSSATPTLLVAPKAISANATNMVEYLSPANRLSIAPTGANTTASAILLSY